MLFTGPLSGYSSTIHTVATDTREEMYGINVIIRIGTLQNTNLFSSPAIARAMAMVKGT